MFKVDNVIILAAGRGTRMQDLCDNTPKPLLKIGQISLIENIINYFTNKGIKRIYIITGYLSQNFNFLATQYANVKLIHNKDWDKGNNILSLKCAKKYISNSLVINGDVIINSDCIPLEYESSCTFAEQNQNINEWIINVDEQDNIISFDKNHISNNGIYQREITILDNDIAKKLKKEFKNFDCQDYYEECVLQVAKKYKLNFKPFIIPKDQVFDIDNKESFLTLNK